MDEIQVSVVCNAYNHEKYIRDALEGFAMQKTNFPFEVLIHDDASTDHTADIIREYEKKYPEIIKPIYETENQYSKKDGSLARIQYGRVKGKYIAMCEGDDYWTDPYKLQKQYDALEANPDINICATAATLEKNGIIVGHVSPKTKDSIISVNEVIIGDGGFVATASLMYRTSIRNNNFLFFNVLKLDYVIQILGSLENGMLFLQDETAVYRMCTEGSWTDRMGKNREGQIMHMEKIIEMLKYLDIDTKHVFHSAVDNRIKKYEFEIILLEDRYRDAISRKYMKNFNDASLKRKVSILIGCIFPKFIASCKYRRINIKR